MDKYIKTAIINMTFSLIIVSISLKIPNLIPESILIPLVFIPLIFAGGCVYEISKEKAQLKHLGKRVEKLEKELGDAPDAE